VDESEFVELLDRQIQKIEVLSSSERWSPEFDKWKRDTEILIEKIFGDRSRHIDDFKEISYGLSYFTSHTPDSAFDKAYQRGLCTAQMILLSLKEEFIKFGSKFLHHQSLPTRNHLQLLDSLFMRFHFVARALRDRHDSRATLELEDEYDVQDLLHALLHLHFSDIRLEETCPSYAGSTSRQDFLLKNEKIVIEVKKTRKGLDAKKLGEELTLDKAKYRTHPDCKTLLCFVYDPEGRIANPRGIENDLSEESPEFTVKVFIKP